LFTFCLEPLCPTIKNNNTGYTLLFSSLSKFALLLWLAGADPGFQVRHLKKLRRAEGGAKISGVFRVKNHDFTPKNHIFSNFRGGGAPWIRPWLVHITTTRQKSPCVGANVRSKTCVYLIVSANLIFIVIYGANISKDCNETDAI
jgi:hypothetical protein